VLVVIMIMYIIVAAFYSVLSVSTIVVSIITDYVTSIIAIIIPDFHFER